MEHRNFESFCSQMHGGGESMENYFSELFKAALSLLYINFVVVVAVAVATFVKCQSILESIQNTKVESIHSKFCFLPVFGKFKRGFEPSLLQLRC